MLSVLALRRIIAGSSEPKRYSSAARDLITSSMYLQPDMSQESFDRKHAHVLKQYIA